MIKAFIHLRTHSEYSIKEGLSSIDALVEQAVEYKMPALALTDCSNLFATVKFYKKCLSSGVKPIIGSEVLVSYQNITAKLLLFAQNKTGYLNLTKLISRSYSEREELVAPFIKTSWFVENNAASTQGLIAIGLGLDGHLGQILLNTANNNNLQAEDFINQFYNLFSDRFYLEITRIKKPHEEKYLNLILPLAVKYNIPLVATNNIMFVDKSDFEAHEARVCINSGHVLSDPNRPKDYTEEQYVKSSEELQEIFKDLPAAVINTYEIARRCTMELTLDQVFLPDFPTPNNISISQHLASQAQIGLVKREESIFRFKKFENPEAGLNYRKVLSERLATELAVINSMGFPGYFLIVADFIAWAKNNGVPVGPGRGSGAGSLVAFALGITDLNPLDYDLLFERFLNPERVSMPDFDIDFCMEGRDRVIDYVANKYGRNAVSQIITFGTMAAKAVIRDVGRVLGHSYGFVDRIAKLIPFEIGMTLDKALEQEPAFRNCYNEDEDIKELVELAKKLEGVARNVGKHAGGVVISPGDLTNFTAIYCEEKAGALVSQFDKDDVEAIGLVKFDFLGLRTLTIINWAVQTINEQLRAKNKPELNIELINLDDQKTYSQLKACETTAIFQLESSGMRDLIRRLQPDCFEDIIALVALFRPGPLQSGMVDDFIDRKHGRAIVEYPHPDLEPILSPTYGVILYQEQVMQIAQVLAGYSLGEADLLRRAMGKKKPEEMAKQREIFIQGSLKNNIAEKTATYIFDLMEKFAGYGFNKSHSAAYALVSYQTAWLKAHYKEAFMAAVLSSDMDNTDKVALFYEECLNHRIKVLKPSINSGYYKFVCNKDNEIIYGLGAIKGLGENAVELIIAERERNGKFIDLYDLCKRVDLRKVNRRGLEAIIKSGAADELGRSRAELLHNINSAIQNSEQSAKNLASGQIDLFGQVIVENIDTNRKIFTEWSNTQILQAERDTLGIFMSGHPLDEYKQELKQLNILKIKQLKINNSSSSSSSVIAGVILAIRRVKTKSGDRIAIITVDDKSARIDIVLSSNEVERYNSLLLKDKIIVISGRVTEDRMTGGLRMVANHIMDIMEAKIAKTNTIRINLNETLLIDLALLENLAELLSEFVPGNCNVLIEYYNSEGRGLIIPDKKWKVTLTQRLLERMYNLIPRDNIVLQCHY
ncbi:MAG: DNA polymerase III subunit alpha [Gammaproteobacteria bacterium]|nr:DNA polymerase III subunit alpha [Gammaproteobacteria bacterium]